MIGWTTRERRWITDLFAAMIPGDPASGLPPLASLDLAPFWAELDRAAPPLLRLGLRASTWALTSMQALSRLDGEAFLSRAAASRFYVVRQMTLTLKAVASMAYLRDPAVRAVVARGEAQ